jgi:hypothetical protein
MQNEYQVLAYKSKSYIGMYIFTMVLLLAVAILVAIPNFTIGVSPLYLLTTIIFIILFLDSLYWFINYLLTPKKILEINDESLKINRKFNKVIVIKFDDLDHSEIAAGILSVFMNNTGNLTIVLKNKTKIRVGYIPDFTKINGQLNSIKYIKALGGIIDETNSKN